MTSLRNSHFGGEVQAVYEVPHEEDGALHPQHNPVKADGHYERDEQHVHHLPQLVRYLELSWRGEEPETTTRHIHTAPANKTWLDIQLTDPF